MSDRSTSRSGSSRQSRSRCGVRHHTPVVLVAVRHPVLRRWTTELLDGACGCWATVVSVDDELLAHAIARINPDVVAVDSYEFPACCQTALNVLRPSQVVVIGPEPNHGYRQSALDLGAGGWVSQDRIADDLVREVWTALGCGRHTCPLQPLMTLGDSSPPTHWRSA